MQTMFKVNAKAKEASKSKKCKKCEYNSSISISSDNE
jgi:hypothetical protein